MGTTITCSNCGVHLRIPLYDSQGIFDAAEYGWNSFGTALYCPSCSNTWGQRNPNKDLCGKEHTVKQIMNQILKSFDEKISRRNW